MIIYLDNLSFIVYVLLQIDDKKVTMLSSEEMGLYSEKKTLDAVENKLKEIYNINMGDKSLHLNKVEFGDYTYDPNDWSALKTAKQNKDTIGRPYYGVFEIKDEGGKTIDKSRIKLGVMPVNTYMDAFLVNGNYYSVPTQFRLKPGAYSRRKESGDYEVFHNVRNGLPMRTSIDPESKKMAVTIRQASIPIYTVLKLTGADDRDIKKALGEEIYENNVQLDTTKDTNKLYRTLFNKSPESYASAVDEIKDYFDKLETTPSVNKKTLNDSLSKVDDRYFLASSGKLLNVIRGITPPDNRDELIYKDVYSVDDMVEDILSRTKKTHRLDWKVKHKLKTKDDIQKVINRNDIDKVIKGIFTTSNLSRYADQTNPLSNEANHYTTTLLGEGGIGSPDVVTMDAKMMQPSHTGFLDPAHTPESFSAGVTLYLANDTKKDGKQLKTKVVNINTNKDSWLDNNTFYDTFVAYPHELRLKNGKWVSDDNEVVGLYQGKQVIRRPSDVVYMLASPDGMFDITSNAIPFLNSDQATRLLTASKMGTQASLLASPDKPLVDVVLNNGKSVLDEIGNKYCIRAKEKGVIIDATPEYILVSGKSGDVRYNLPSNMPLNGDSYLDSVLRVRVGDRVEKGDLLADTNSTIDGKLSTGKNLNVAYLPYKGLNYEDAVVISESAAKKLATSHLHKIHIPKESIFDFNKYRAFSPYDIKDDDVDRYDEDGVIKPGQDVMPDDIVAASMKKRSFSLADTLIQRLKKSVLPPLKADPVHWDRSVSGKVTDVIKVKDGIDVYVKTVEPVTYGDKLVGRHGNKATVSYIIPDEHAPRTASGDVIDIIMDPHGVSPRINYGQLLETAAGKLASKTGKPFVVENFSDKDYRSEILKDLKRHGIPEKEDIIDPSTGKTIPGVFTGVQYINKLKHQVENKISARGIDEPYNANMQPTRGKGTGGQSLDNLTTNILLAHNARGLIRDSFSIKNNPNREYWRAVQNGIAPPAPKAPYEYTKFEALLKGMGINMDKAGDVVKLSPLTDAQTRAISKGEIKEPYRMFKLRGDDIDPEKKGLFGSDVGGLKGNVFNHIELPDRIPSPVYKDAIKSVLGITDKEFDKLLEE